MKTTVDLPEDLLVAAKKKAAEDHMTLREILERGLRRELSRRGPAAARRRRLRWITVHGGLPPGLEVADRVSLHEWIRRQR